jgi:hypothetical protein
MPFLFSLGISGRDAEPIAARGCRPPIGDPELARMLGDVQCGGLRAHEKRLGDLTVGQTPRHQGQNLLLTGCETELGEPLCITQRSKINNRWECDDGHSGQKSGLWRR